ncbi:tetratricopeptide repeat protein [Winogradskyella sp. J14-2]|uniref:tetratricopeptide repeat-containing sensor histidine kinase n=1 Tax=Winogradskyella sp. J14-2 TaxID=1936080 RepID=UPI001E3FA7F9|nr:tetratricopeptide repeat protein [Winogradskyella sp. J14-2]
MKSIYFLITIVLLPLAGFSQNAKIDSLKLELQNHKKKDTVRVTLLYDLAFSLYQKDAGLTNTYIKEAEALSNKLNYRKGKADILSLKGIMASRTSHYHQSLVYFQKSLELFKDLNDRKGIASSYNSIGVNFLLQSKNIEALDNLKKAIAIYEGLGAQEQLVAGYLNIGNIYAKTGKYKEAISYYEKTLKLSKAINHEYGIPYTLNGLGHIYSEQGNHYKAMDYYHQSLLYKEKLSDTIGMSKTLNSLGNSYRSLGKLDKSLEYHKKSTQLAEVIGNKDLIAVNKGNIGHIYTEKKDYNKALEYINESLKLSREIGDLGQISNCLYSIGEINLLLKQPEKARKSFEKSTEISLQNDNQYSLAANYLGIAESYYDEKAYQKALSYTLKGKRIADDLNLLEAKSKVSEMLSSIYENLGNYEQSLKEHQNFKKLNDSLFNEENIKKMTELEYEYKYKQQLDSLSINELKLTKTVLTTSQDLEKTQRNLFLGIIGFLATAIILGGIIFFLKLRHEKAKTLNAVIEQKLLRSQMTPHFIFNSLSVLQGMILNKEDKKSVFYLSKFSKLLRITLENSRDKLVPLNQELEAVNNYLELQNLEASQSYDYTILVDQNIDETLYKIPPMLIQPFIENAVEHAFEDRKDNRKIDIQLKNIDDKLVCTITDNGIGIDTPNGHKRKDKKSLATTITSERLKMLSKDLDINGSVHIEDRKHYNEQGTIVTLVIPYKKEVA